MTLQNPPRNPPPLPELFAEAVLPHPPLTAVRDATQVCYRIAYAYLSVRARGMPAFSLGATLDDLAFDAVCYLFERNGTGEDYPRFRSHFSAEHPRRMSEAKILSVLRATMASYLEAEFVRRVIDSYPPIERILRNLKNAVSASKALHDVRIGEEHWITVDGAVEVHEALPEFPPALLERILVLNAGKRSTSPALVPVLVKALRDQSTYRKAFRLSGLAVIVLGMYFRTGRLFRGAVSGTRRESGADISRNVLRSVAEVETRLRRSLVEKEGIPASTYIEYVHAAAEYLLASLHPSLERDLSLYEILAGHLVGLTRSAYYTEHRPRLEYIIQSTSQQYYQREKIA